jgi:hypothetical protein
MLAPHERCIPGLFLRLHEAPLHSFELQSLSRKPFVRRPRLALASAHGE